MVKLIFGTIARISYLSPIAMVHPVPAGNGRLPAEALPEKINNPYASNSMQTKIRLLALLVFIPVLAHAQPTAGSRVTRTSADLRLGSSSYLIYPGITAGIELPVRVINLTRTRARGETKTIAKERFVAAGLGWYHHPGFHDNAYLTVEWIRRRTRPGGFFTQFAPGIGYSRTFLGGTTFRVSDGGEVSVRRLAGHGYALATVGGGLRYDFSRRKAAPLSVFYRVNLLAMLPYNGSVYLRPVTAVGLICKPANFLAIKTITKCVTR